MIRFLAVISFIAWGTLNCAEQTSTAKIDSGVRLSIEKDSWAPGVVKISGCTATVVSQNTLLVAASCLHGTGSTVCVNSGLYQEQRVCTNKTFVHPQYSSTRAYPDMAVAIFQDKPFQDFHRVANEEGYRSPTHFTLKDALIVGYGTSYLSKIPQDRYPKNWGIAAVVGLARVNADRTIHSKSNRSFQKSGIMPGDGGGPMLDAQCQAVGIASRVDSFQGENRTSFHTNLNARYAMGFMKEMVVERGAQICGIEGTEEAEYCISVFEVRPVEHALETDGTPRFPCHSKRDAQETDRFVDRVDFTALKKFSRK